MSSSLNKVIIIIIIIIIIMPVLVRKTKLATTDSFSITYLLLKIEIRSFFYVFHILMRNTVLLKYKECLKIIF